MRLAMRLVVWVCNIVLAVSLAGLALLRLGPPPWHWEVEEPSILNVRDDTMHVRLPDDASRRPLVHVPARVDGVVQVQCSNALCPPLKTHWSVRTDARGWLVIPRAAVGTSTRVRTPEHVGDLP